MRSSGSNVEKDQAVILLQRIYKGVKITLHDVCVSGKAKNVYKQTRHTVGQEIVRRLGALEKEFRALPEAARDYALDYIPIGYMPEADGDD